MMTLRFGLVCLILVVSVAGCGGSKEIEYIAPEMTEEELEAHKKTQDILKKTMEYHQKATGASAFGASKKR